MVQREREPFNCNLIFVFAIGRNFFGQGAAGGTGGAGGAGGAGGIQAGAARAWAGGIATSRSSRAANITLMTFIPFKLHLVNATMPEG